jgi:hypothetical protein
MDSTLPTINTGRLDEAGMEIACVILKPDTIEDGRKDANDYDDNMARIQKFIFPLMLAALLFPAISFAANTSSVVTRAILLHLICLQ